MNPLEPSLLTHLEEVRTLRASNADGISSHTGAEPSSTGLTTVIYCGYVHGGEEAVQSALAAHRAQVEEVVNQENAEVTGILIGQGPTILHLLEGPCSAILTILSSLASHPNFLSKPNENNSEIVSSPIESGRIVFNTEDRPERFFPEWYSTILDEHRLTSSEDVLTPENCEDVVFDAAMNLLDMGVRIRTEAQEGLELHRFAEKLPGKPLVQALSTANEFFPLHEFVSMYTDPFHIDLDSERTWPLERLVHY